jgi:hypothetical protein
VRKTLWAALAIVALPGLAAAQPVTFGTYIDVGVTGGLPITVGQFGRFDDERFNRNAFGPIDVRAFGRVDIREGAVHALNSGVDGIRMSAATDTLFFDTLTFDGSAFRGFFGTSYDLVITANFDGTMARTGTIDSAGVGGFIRVYSGTAPMDASIFNTSSTLIDFLFLDPDAPTPLCSSGVNGPDIATVTGRFAFSTSCTIRVTAASPSIRIMLNMSTFVNSTNASWSLDMLNTGSLSMDFGGRMVTSDSGGFPGTVSDAAAVPEPGTLGLLGLGLVGVARSVRRRAVR